MGKNVYLGEARAGRFERDSMGRLMYIKLVKNKYFKSKTRAVEPNV